MPFKAIELDQAGTTCRANLSCIDHGAQLHDALKKITGQNTVPNVFINGKHIGGCDDTLALQRAGQLRSKLDVKQEL